MAGPRQSGLSPDPSPKVVLGPDPKTLKAEPYYGEQRENTQSEQELERCLFFVARDKTQYM